MSPKRPAPPDVDAYLREFPPDVQALLARVRATVREAAPDAITRLANRFEDERAGSLFEQVQHFGDPRERPVFRLQRRLAATQVGYASDSHDVLLDLYGADVEYSADSLEAIYDRYKDVALLSKFSGGIGIAFGFIFIRFAPGLPSVAEMMAPYAEELAAFELEKLVPNGRVTLRPRPVNWKNVGDNYSDGMHIPVAHPGLSRLLAGTYKIEAKPWIDKMWGYVTETPSNHWPERQYQKLLGTFDHIPEGRRRLWAYYKLWPNVALDIYPDQVDFMQFIPVSATQTMIREIAYVHPNANREMNAARYLNWRINRQVNAEDTVLIEGVQQGMESSSYATGPLSPSEVCLISFGNRMRDLIPEANLERAPA